MSDELHNDDFHHHYHAADLPVPPPPPQVVTVHIYRSGVWEATYRNVKESTVVGPSTFRFETLEGEIMLFDMTGRDFVLRPQVSDV